MKHILRILAPPLFMFVCTVEDHISPTFPNIVRISGERVPNLSNYGGPLHSWQCFWGGLSATRHRKKEERKICKWKGGSERREKHWFKGSSSQLVVDPWFKVPYSVGGGVGDDAGAAAVDKHQPLLGWGPHHKMLTSSPT